MYVADTHAWIYYLLNKLPAKSNSIFASVERGEDFIVVPTIALSECIHLIESKRITVTFEDIFSRFEKGSNFLVVPLNFEITKFLPSIKIKELHDKIIVATTKFISATLITKDKDIIKSKLVNTVWN